MPAPRKMIEELIRVANDMDAAGMIEEADELTRIAQEFMDDPQSDELPEAAQWDALQDEDDETRALFEPKSREIHDPSHYVKRIEEFRARLHDLAQEVTGFEEFAARAKAIAEAEFPDLFFESDNIIDDAATEFLKERPEDLRTQIREHAFEPKANEFKDVLEEAGLTVR